MLIQATEYTLHLLHRLINDPKDPNQQWSVADFEQLYNCMQQHYKALHQSIEESKSFQRYQFGGMVYGNEESFVKEYAKNKKDFFSIHPDGKIAHHYEERGLKVTSSNGLSMYGAKRKCNSDRRLFTDNNG